LGEKSLHKMAVLLVAVVNSLSLEVVVVVAIVAFAMVVVMCV
jgi:hypothetical protein